MALPQIISRNAAQKIPSIAINSRTVVQPVTHYTCPTGQKAHIKGRIQCTGRGAAATATFAIAGVNMYIWDRSTIAVADYLTNPQFLTTQAAQMALFETDLAAGETVITDQNTGTNAEFNLFMEVTETPV